MGMKKIIVGNWKMNPVELSDAEEILREVAAGTGGFSGVNIVICPPFTFLENLVTLSSKKIAIGAQDCFFGSTGAYTGEVSAEMLRGMGVKYVIVGHSERRALGDSDELINKKVASALSSGLKVIICVGEKERDDSGEYLNFIRKQLTVGLNKIRKSLLKNLIVAYEPVWAIGKNAVRVNTPEDTLEVSIFIKRVLVEMFGREGGIKVPILYGGSVDTNNCEGFLRDGKADGLLVGRESLHAVNFIKIIRIVNEL